MNYESRIQKIRDEFDQFLFKFDRNCNKYFYLYLIRNAYSALHELNQDRETMRGLFNITLALVRSILKVLISIPILSDYSEIVFLNAFTLEKDKYVAEELGIPLVNIKYKIVFSSKNIKNIICFLQWFMASIHFLTKKKLNKLVVYKCLSSMLTGIHCYQQIDLNGIKKIITMYDRYAVEIAIIKKAKKEGIKTIRVDCYPYTTSTGMGYIDCEYYFYPNNIALDIFKVMDKENQVKYIEGGLPYWDIYGNSKYEPANNPRIISFWTEYGAEIGMEGLDKMGSSFYIEEILSVIPDDSVLWIKVHPLDKPEKYYKYKSEKVKIIKHGDVDNVKLFCISYFVIAIFSSAVFEAKHICPNSCYINYAPDSMGIDWNYEQLTDYIDLISNQNELENFLFGRMCAKDQEAFLNFFNPGFPDTIKKLGTFLDSI